MGKPTEDSKLVIRGRKISNADIDEVRTLIELQGKQGRAHISRRLAEQWQWKQANGRLTRLSQFAPQKGHFWAFVSWKPLIFLGSISKTACSADLPS